MTSFSDLKKIRRDLRFQRRQVNQFVHVQSEAKIMSHLLNFPKFKYAKKIGIYLHAFGEIQTQLIIHKCFELGKEVYLPMICNMDQKLVWVRIRRQQYINHRFSQHPLGMKEPMQSRGLNVSKLDLLFMPLLACDTFGTRIGMGGGYYDRTLANAVHKPIRVGLAHDFQLINQRLPKQKWDQSLDYLFTPNFKLHFKRY